MAALAADGIALAIGDGTLDMNAQYHAQRADATTREDGAYQLAALSGRDSVDPT